MFFLTNTISQRLKMESKILTRSQKLSAAPTNPLIAFSRNTYLQQFSLAQVYSYQPKQLIHFKFRGRGQGIINLIDEIELANY